MKLSIPIGYLRERYGMERALVMAKEAGFDAVDFSLSQMEKTDSPFNGSDWQDYARELRRISDTVGLPINQTHAPIRFKPEQWADMPFMMDLYERALAISGILGADVSVIHPFHYSGIDGCVEECFEKNMRFYGDLIPAAVKAGVRIGVENMWRHDPRRKFISYDTCSEAVEFVRYIDALDHDSVVACLDIGHVGLIPQKDEAWDVIRALGHKRLHALHVHDNDYCNDYHLVPYTGKINWSEVTRALGEIDYDGDFTYETSAAFLGNMDDRILPTGMKFMVDVGRHLMTLVDESRPSEK